MTHSTRQDSEFMVSAHIADRIDADSILTDVREDAHVSSRITPELTRSPVRDSLFTVMVTLLDEEKRAGAIVSFVKCGITRSVTFVSSDRALDDIVTSEICRIEVVSKFEKHVLDATFTDDDQPNIELHRDRVTDEFQLTLSYDVTPDDIVSEDLHSSSNLIRSPR